MKAIILLLFIILSLECYSQEMRIINIPRADSDTIIKDDPMYLGVVIYMKNTTCIEGSNVILMAYVGIHIYPETSIQGALHAYIVPYTPLAATKPTEVVIWGYRLKIINGKKYMKL